MMICVILYALSCVADMVQCSIRAAIQIKPLLLLLLSDGLLSAAISNKHTTASHEQ